MPPSGSLCICDPPSAIVTIMPGLTHT
jgi:hypothetical protein